MMRSTRNVSRAIGVGLALQLVTAGGAVADPGPVSHVESLTASVSPGSVGVTGAATFVDVPGLVGEDTPGDALVTGAGLDMTNITVARPDPAKTTLRFTINIADQPATLNGIPEVTAFDWPFKVTEGDTSDEFMLHAQRSAQSTTPGSTNPVFVLYKCTLDPSTNVNNCSKSGNNLVGKIADGVVQMDVPMSRISAAEGNVIEAGSDAIVAVPSLAGAFWGVVLFDQAGMDNNYVVAGKSVQLGIAPAGTPADKIKITEDAIVNSTGTFTGAIPTAGLAPGSYVVAAKACFGPTSCSISTTPVTI